MIAACDYLKLGVRPVLRDLSGLGGGAELIVLGYQEQLGTRVVRSRHGARVHNPQGRGNSDPRRQMVVIGCERHVAAEGPAC